MIASETGRVSIIICLFNVARFLESKRLSCILNQTWSNLEIILVNDGSSDQTWSICQDLASVDTRIVLVNKTNGGLGSARNAGLDAAKGEFIWFYDVDDDAELDLVEKNIGWMREYVADMTVFGCWFIDPDTGHAESSRFNDKLYQTNEALKAGFVRDLFLVPNGNGFVWNKFYRRDFIETHGFRFPEERIQQDELFNMTLYPHVNRLFLSSEPLYRYYIYKSGNNRSRYIPDRILIYETVFNSLQNLRREWGLQTEELEAFAYHRFYQGIESSVLFNTFHPDAPSSKKWKRQEVSMILSRPLVRQCMKYVNEHNQFNLERRLFLGAFLSGDFFRMDAMRIVGKTLRKIKTFLRVK